MLDRDQKSRLLTSIVRVLSEPGEKEESLSREAETTREERGEHADT